MNRHFILTTIVSISSLFAPVAVFAQDGSDSSEQAAEYHPITSVDALTLGKGRANALTRAAEYCVEHEQYDKAIKLSRMALDKNDDNNETHQVYAEALEGKLRGQVERDPMVFNQCVKEWLIVLRQEAGDEKLANSHGLSIPGMGHLYQDEDSVIPARRHLMKLTGRTPKIWETDGKYLQKVLKPTTETVTGKVVPAESAPASPENQQ